MVSVIFRGGLGAVMFQIAATYALALDNNDECVFTLDIYSKKTVNDYPEIFSFLTEFLFKKLKQVPDSWVPESVYIEPKFSYVPIPYSPNMLLDGCFYTEKYFVKYKSDIINLFKDTEIIEGIKKRFDFKDSASIHVRKTDFVLWKSDFLNEYYYNNAISYIDDRVYVDKIYVLSDDIIWCKEHLKDNRLIFVDGNYNYIDMYIMSCCDHNIIANSGFSWWGSYLNENPNKIVCAPDRWLSPLDTKGIKDDILDIYYDGVNILPSLNV